MPTSSEDDEPITLSAGAAEALRDFYSEEDARAKQFEELKARAENDADDRDLTMNSFTEDWNASQFWYSEETATILAKELLDGASKDTCIAVVSAPSVFVKIKHILASRQDTLLPRVVLLEYDQRFDVFKEFVPYDFQHPFRLPPDMKGNFDRIICDPPFLSEDCQSKMAMTVRWLSKSALNGPTSLDSEIEGFKSNFQELSAGTVPFRLVLCTGERMGGLVKRLHKQVGLRTTTFEPRHAKGLSNEFQCYANFECDNWKWS